MGKKLDIRLRKIVDKYKPETLRRGLKLASKLIQVDDESLKHYRNKSISGGLAQSLLETRNPNSIKDFNLPYSGAFVDFSRDSTGAFVDFSGDYAGLRAIFSGNGAGVDAIFSGDYAGLRAIFSGNGAGDSANFSGDYAGNRANFSGDGAGDRANFSGDGAGGRAIFSEKITNQNLSEIIFDRNPNINLADCLSPKEVEKMELDIERDFHF